MLKMRVNPVTYWVIALMLAVLAENAFGQDRIVESERLASQLVDSYNKALQKLCSMRPWPTSRRRRGHSSWLKTRTTTSTGNRIPVGPTRDTKEEATLYNLRAMAKRTLGEYRGAIEDSTHSILLAIRASDPLLISAGYHHRGVS